MDVDFVVLTILALAGDAHLGETYLRVVVETECEMLRLVVGALKAVHARLWFRASLDAEEREGRLGGGDSFSGKSGDERVQLLNELFGFQSKSTGGRGFLEIVFNGVRRLRTGWQIYRFVGTCLHLLV